MTKRSRLCFLQVYNTGFSGAKLVLDAAHNPQVCIMPDVSRDVEYIRHDMWTWCGAVMILNADSSQFARAESTSRIGEPQHVQTCSHLCDS